MQCFDDRQHLVLVTPYTFSLHPPIVPQGSPFAWWPVVQCTTIMVFIALFWIWVVIVWPNVVLSLYPAVLEQWTVTEPDIFKSNQFIDFARSGRAQQNTKSSHISTVVRKTTSNNATTKTQRKKIWNKCKCKCSVY